MIEINSFSASPTPVVLRRQWPKQKTTLVRILKKNSLEDIDQGELLEEDEDKSEDSYDIGLDHVRLGHYFRPGH